MIIGTFFTGDDNYDLKIKQHKIYSRAIGLMLTKCNDLSVYAPLPDHLGPIENWGKVDRFDHRTIQYTHDLLAAAYRYKASIDPKESSSLLREAPESCWLTWFMFEVESWWKTPIFLQYYLTIMSNQNDHYGYLAESQLCLAILDRFPDVPWTPEHRIAFAKDLGGYTGMIKPSTVTQ